MADMSSPPEKIKRYPSSKPRGFARWSEARFLNRFSISSRLTIGFTLLVVLTLFVTGLSYVSSQRAIASINRSNALRMPTALASASARANLLKMRSNIHSYLVLGEEEYRISYEEARKDFEADLLQMEELSDQWTNPENNRRLERLKGIFADWSELPAQMFALRDDPLQNQPAFRILTHEGEESINAIRRDLNSMMLQQVKRTPTQENMTLLKEIADVQSSFAVMVSHLRGYLLTSNLQFKQVYQAQQRANRIQWEKLASKRQLLTADQQVLLDKISAKREDFLQLPRRMFAVVESQRAYEDRFLFKNEAVPRAEEMLQLLDAMTLSQQMLLQEDLMTGSNQLVSGQFLTLFGGGAALLFGVFMAYVFRHNIASPIKRLTHVVEHITAGNLNAQAAIESQDEIGSLARAFNTMTRNVRTSQKKLEGYNYTLEQKVAQRTAELEKAMKDAQEAQMIAEHASQAKSQFLANMSHELRTPLNAVIGYSEMLKEDAEDLGCPEFITDLDKIYTGGKHLLALINDILDISKIEAGRMELHIESFGITDLLENVETTIHPLAQRNGNTLEVEVAPDIGSMQADQTKVRQILMNLLSNACKFTEHGVIRMHVRTISEEERLQEDKQFAAVSSDVRFREAQEWVAWHITDTGIGISPEQLPQLFQAFTQADASTTRKYGGTGLGLAISYQYCQLMGGTIRVRSVPGEGSTFAVYLPVDVQAYKTSREREELMEEASHAALNNQQQAAAQDGDRIRGTVLVIDDDADSRNMVARYLAKEHLHVETATGGKEGLQRAKKLHPDAITLDVMMPEMDGWTVLAAIKSDPELADIPVIMITMVDEEDVGFALGASDYLLKPIERQHLLRIVRKYQQSDEQTSQHGEAPATEAGYVLVVEDDEATRNLLRRSLEKEGWRVVEAHNGRVAMEHMAEHPPDLMVLDLMMPEMDGFQVITQVRSAAEWRSIPIIVVTAMELSTAERQFLDHSVSRVLRKASFDREQLLQEVQHLVLRCIEQTKGTSIGKIT
jgi:signal transduction histidine kinase/CheY-like chemotaxis protein